MYFTTQNGIYYYDGYAFSRLAIDSLRSNALQGIAFHGQDELYLSLRDEGLASYHLKTGEFRIDSRLKLGDNNADEFLIEGNFAYLLTTEIRLVIVDLKTGKVKPDAERKPGRPNPPYCLYRSRAGKVLVGRSDGLYDASSGSQVRMEALRGHPIHSLAEDRQGRLIAGSSGRIFILDKGKIEREIIPVFRSSGTFDLGGEKSITRIVADDYGRIWFTAFPEENLYLFENNALHDVFALLGIPPSLVRCVFADSQQNVWIGTFSDGVYFIQNSFFTNLTFAFNGKNLNVNQVSLAGNLLLAATSNGLYGMNLSGTQARVLSHPDELFMEPVTGITALNGGYYYTKRSQVNISPTIFLDSERAYRFRPVIARQFYPIDEGKSIVADWYANILLCSGDGSRTLDTLISFSDYRIAVNSMLKVKDTLYIATSNGLFRYLFKTERYEVMVRNDLNFHINDVAVVNDRLYAAHEAGITDVHGGRLIQQVGSFRLNSVRKIRQLGDQVWLATLDGVYICDRNFDPLKILSKSNGLLSNSINDISFGEDQVCIATARGVSVAGFRDILRHSSKLRAITIRSVMANGSEMPLSAGGVTLQPVQEDVTVSFYSPVFHRPNRQFFRYSLDGGEWSQGGSIPEVKLALRAGIHELRISASADNIVWSDPTTLLLFKKEKLSEKAYVFWLVAIAALAIILGGSYLIIRRVKINARKRLLEEQQVNLLKHQAMNALLSPHFIFNSLTSIQNYINTNNSLKASEYLAKFSRLIRMIIEKAGLGTISLHDELARLTYYLELEKERFKNKFEYAIHIDENINTHLIMIPNMIIQPHVENCILHGILPKHEPGRLEIYFQKPSQNQLRILIQDDGIGLIKAAENAKTGHKSLGLSTIRNILEINSKLTGKKQAMTMTDRSTLDPALHGTFITIELEL